jgi:regulator of sigma E protease
MATMEAIEGKAGEPRTEPLAQISAMDKIIVAFAGPLFSFLLALAFAVVVMVVGRPVSEAETTTVIGYVEKGGPADKAGLRPGDKILAVDGKPVSKFGGMGDSVTWHVVRSEGVTVAVKVQRDGNILEFAPAPVKEPTKVWQRQGLRQIKIAPSLSTIIGKVVTNSPAARAGLVKGDEILEVNGVRLYHPVGLADYQDAHPGEKLNLVVRRAASNFEASAQPEMPVSPPSKVPRIGIVEWDDRTALAHPGAIEQVRASVMAMVDTFGALFAKGSDIKPQHLGGAVKIMDVYSRLFASEQGWRLALWFSVLMNVNLAILNLLPFPVLDGGHITLAILEGIRKKPLSARFVNAVQTVCAAALIIFMVYIAFYDVQELPWKREKAKSEEVIFDPKHAPATDR